MIQKQIIYEGDIYWIAPEHLIGHDSATRHPYVVIQNDVINHSRISTVVVCALTSNTNRANLPGNVLLDDGEANLVKRSVVEVSKVSTVNKAHLTDYIGTLSTQRTQQIFAGMRLLQSSYVPR